MNQLVMTETNRWIINIRVSKMGGILRTLEITQEARRKNIPIIVGAQVEETSLLTRAAMTVANASRDILYAQEGAFGTRLLEKDICQPAIMFGQNGLIKTDTADFTKLPGLGLAVNLDRH